MRRLKIDSSRRAACCFPVVHLLQYLSSRKFVVPLLKGGADLTIPTCAAESGGEAQSMRLPYAH